jgi:hypothetical protein
MTELLHDTSANARGEVRAYKLEGAEVTSIVGLTRVCRSLGERGQVAGLQRQGYAEIATFPPLEPEEIGQLAEAGAKIIEFPESVLAQHLTPHLPEAA